MASPRDELPVHPVIYQMRASVLLETVCAPAAPWRRATLADTPLPWLQDLATTGVDILYLLGVWTTSGGEGVAVSRARLLSMLPATASEKERTAAAQSAVSSAFAIADYTVAAIYGGDAAVQALKKMCEVAGLRLVLDFVPNHVALDHAWCSAQPWLIQQGTAEDAARHPDRYYKVTVPAGLQSPLPGAAAAVSSNTNNSTSSNTVDLYLAHGRDGHSYWMDTVNVNMRHPIVRDKLRGMLASIATRQLCHGVRTDMAMLLLEPVISKIWGEAPATVPGPGPAAPQELQQQQQGAVKPVVGEEFWPGAIAAVRSVDRHFLLLGECYWGLEPRILELGFDAVYAKSLTDSLLLGNAESVLAHLRAPLTFQQRCIRFVENHDEARIAAAHRGGDRGAMAAATLALLSPGLAFIFDGQQHGRRLHHSMHMGPRPAEPCNLDMLSFYRRLMAVLALPEVKTGRWHLTTVTPSRDGNQSYKDIIAFFITPAPQKRASAARSEPAAPVSAPAPAPAPAPASGSATALSTAAPDASRSGVAPTALVPASTASSISASPTTSITNTTSTSTSAISAIKEFLPLPAAAVPAAAVPASPAVPASAAPGAAAPAVAPSRPQVVGGNGSSAVTAGSGTSSTNIDSAASTGPTATATSTAAVVKQEQPQEQPQTVLCAPAPASEQTVAPPQQQQQQQQQQAAASVGADSAIAAALEGVPHIAGRTLLVLVNYSDHRANGHLVFHQPDDSARGCPELHSAIAHVAALVLTQQEPCVAGAFSLAHVAPAPSTLLGALSHTHTGSSGSSTSFFSSVSAQGPGGRVGGAGGGSGSGVDAAVGGGGVGGGGSSASASALHAPSPSAEVTSPTPSTPALTSVMSASGSPVQAMASPAALVPAVPATDRGAVKRLGFIDHLAASTCYSYPAAAIAAEGWWVDCLPWTAHVFEVVQLSEA